MTEYWVFQDKSFKRACIHRSNCSVRQGTLKSWPFRGDLARRVSDLRESTPHGGGDVPSKTRPAKLPPLPPARLLNNGSPAVTQRLPPGRFDSRGWRGPTRLTRRGIFPGRAARGSISPRKATCQVPASGLHLVQGRRRALRRERPRRQGPGPPASFGPRGCYPKAGRTEVIQSSREGSRHALYWTRTGIFFASSTASAEVALPILFRSASCRYDPSSLKPASTPNKSR